MEQLDFWPDLPVVISGECHSTIDVDNIMAALEHHDRVCQIELSLKCELDDIFEALEEPFPELTVLKLHSTDTPDPILPISDQYLGGTTHLRSLSLTCIPILGLPDLLLSSTDLVDLRLMQIPISVFVPSDEMVTALSALTRLQVLHLGPEFDEFHPDWENRSLPLPTRTVLPSLIELRFEGVIEYLDDFMARIDAPLLNHLDILVSFFLDRVIVFNGPQILRFIGHVPKFQELGEAHVGIGNFKIWINFFSTGTSSDGLKLKILCIEPEQDFPVLAQFCRLPFFPLPTLESLYIDSDGDTHLRQRLRDCTENSQWLELLQPFTSVKNLYLSKYFARLIAPALEELGGEIATGVLPTLENVFIEKFQLYGRVHEAFMVFTATRQLSGHPIVVSDWDRTGLEADH